MLIRNTGKHAPKPSEITPPEVFDARRKLLKAAALAGVGAALPAHADLVGPQGSKPLLKGLQDSGYGAGLKPTDYQDVTSYNNFYEFGTSKSDPKRYAGSLVTRPWTVKVDGECENPGQIGIEDILSGIQQEQRIYRFRCVEAWAMVVPWDGFPLARLLKRFQPTSRARYVRFETLYDPKQMPGQQSNTLDWPYVEGLRMDEAMHPLSMLVTGMYGRELPNQDGAPLRLIVPWKYGFKSIKSIVRISFVQDIPDTTWWKLAPNEYGFYANVNPHVDHPRWSQKYQRELGAGLFAGKEPTLMFNGYGEQVASLYKGMNLRKFF